MKQPSSQRAISFEQIHIEDAKYARSPLGTSEDFILIDTEQSLFGVFDSVGGRDNGQFVSHLAGRFIASAWHNQKQHAQMESREAIEDFLQEVIHQADQQIASLIIPAGQKRPATTVALGILSRQQETMYLTIAHVGDSRIYLQRQTEALQRLTQDHGSFSFAQQRGLLTKEESRRIEQAMQRSELSEQDYTYFLRRNKITCAVGWSDFVHVPVCSLPLIDGDHVLFCTDGLHDNLTDQEIAETLQTTHAEQLIHLAHARSQDLRALRAKNDDLSALVLRYREQA